MTPEDSRTSVWSPPGYSWRFTPLLALTPQRMNAAYMFVIVVVPRQRGTGA